MNIIVETAKIFKLSLSEREAVWLASLLQNPANNIHPSEEDSVDKEIRKELFEGLYKELYLRPPGK